VRHCNWLGLILPHDRAVLSNTCSYVKAGLWYGFFPGFTPESPSFCLDSSDIEALFRLTIRTVEPAAQLYCS
jgi:hypothetical protein